jgi:flavin reductase (DIM6/NTAB) family NADH-FMN oxidoreductase RutF
MMDKLGRSLQLSASTRVRAPLIDECFLNIECRVLTVVQVGFYDVFLGQMLAMHCDAEAYSDGHEKGAVNWSAV